MKLYLKLLFISMISFIYAECSEIDNQDDCERFEWCEWIESDNVPNGGVCTGEWEDDEDGEDDEEEFEGRDNQEEILKVVSGLIMQVVLKVSGKMMRMVKMTKKKMFRYRQSRRM